MNLTTITIIVASGLVVVGAASILISFIIVAKLVSEIFKQLNLLAESSAEIAQALEGHITSHAEQEEEEK